MSWLALGVSCVAFVVHVKMFFSVRRSVLRAEASVREAELNIQLLKDRGYNA